MSDLYWILTLGDLHNFFAACLVISIGMFIYFFIIATVADSKCDGDTQEKKALNIAASSFIVVIICTLLTIFIPSKKELYMIYGVGITIEYLKYKPNAKNLPDKCVNALERWADEFNKENNKDS